jgi:hypothetical protein
MQSRRGDGAHEAPHGWRRDERGNLYRVLTPAEQAQVRAARTREESGPPSEAEEHRAA